MTIAPWDAWLGCKTYREITDELGGPDEDTVGRRGNAYWMGFGPTNVALWRMAAVLEAKDHERAVTIAESLNPRVHLPRSRQAAYWMDYGRLRGRHDDAVTALRRAEALSPLHTLRDPFVREVIAELHVRSRRDAVGWELRGMTYRAPARA